MENDSWKPDMVCPICENYKFVEEYDICHICFWENDALQFRDFDYVGVNNISLKGYKKWWNVLELIMPKLMQKYKITQPQNSAWKYDLLIVPRENIKNFIEELTNHNIGIRLSFYNWADKFELNKDTFVPFPLIGKKTILENNNEALEIIFTDNPIKTCKNYGLKQVVKILKKSKDVKNLWESLSPYICIEPNPKYVPF